MQYAVGYQYLNGGFYKIIEDYKEHIAEVYFSWLDSGSGRVSATNDKGYIDWHAQDQLISDLKKIKALGIKLDLLFNASCYGGHALSEYLANNICSIIDYLVSVNCAIDIITTTSPFIASIVKNQYKDIEVRASVNMKAGSIKAMQYISDYFDSFYIQRDYNRDFNIIKQLKNWADKHNKGLYLLANSGCMRDCSGQMFHDNAVSHSTQISKMKNLRFSSNICYEYLKNPKHWVSVLQNTWIRPEDISHYEKYFNVVKLATRTHELPGMVISSYIRQSYYGNLLDLFEPGFGWIFAPYVIDNSRFPKDWFETITNCDKNCNKCNYCNLVLEQVLVKNME